jgi:hypothetical protein
VALASRVFGPAGRRAFSRTANRTRAAAPAPPIPPERGRLRRLRAGRTIALMRSLPRILLALGCTLLLLAAAGPVRAQVAVVFGDSPDTTQWAASWGFASGGSSLALAGTSHFPVQSHTAFLGNNALRLAWTAASGGDWALTAAAANWTPFDTAPYDTLVFAMQSPEGIDAANLPFVFLEDATNTRTPSMYLALFAPQAPSGAWTRVAIPMSAFRSNHGGADLARINKVFFSQTPAMTAGAPHQLYVDELRFVAAGLPVPAMGPIEARGFELHAATRARRGPASRSPRSRTAPRWTGAGPPASRASTGQSRSAPTCARCLRPRRPPRSRARSATRNGST